MVFKKKKKKPEVGPGFYQKNPRPDPRPDLRPGLVKNLAPKIIKMPFLYIFLYSNPNQLIPHFIFFTLQTSAVALTLLHSSLLPNRQSLILPQSGSPSPSAHAVSQSRLPQSCLLTLTPSITPPSPPHPHSSRLTPSSPVTPPASTADASFRRIACHPTCKFYFFFLFLFVSKFWI